jgi:hypothetical protein
MSGYRKRKVKVLYIFKYIYKGIKIFVYKGLYRRRIYFFFYNLFVHFQMERNRIVPDGLTIN